MRDAGGPEPRRGQHSQRSGNIPSASITPSHTSPTSNCQEAHEDSLAAGSHSDSVHGRPEMPGNDASQEQWSTCDGWELVNDYPSSLPSGELSLRFRPHSHSRVLAADWAAQELLHAAFLFPTVHRVPEADLQPQAHLLTTLLCLAHSLLMRPN